MRFAYKKANHLDKQTFCELMSTSDREKLNTVIGLHQNKVLVKGQPR